MTRKEILDQIARYEAVLAAGEKDVMHIVKWAWSHIRAAGHVGSLITDEVRAKLHNLHKTAHSRVYAVAAPQSGSGAAVEAQAHQQGSAPGTPPATSPVTPAPALVSPDPNDKS